MIDLLAGTLYHKSSYNSSVFEKMAQIQYKICDRELILVLFTRGHRVYFGLK